MGTETEDRQPHTISSSTPPHRSFGSSRPEPQKASVIAVLLSRLAVHFYRPDFTENQAKSLILDMVEDLGEFAVCDVETAIREYRRDPEARFFPRSGELCKRCYQARYEREQADKRAATTPEPPGEHHPVAQRGPEFGEFRPLMWWGLPKALWKPHWRDEEIPDEWRAVVAQRRLNAEAAQ
jgi:hypothetical protein